MTITSTHPADRLIAAIERTSPVCVGIDPVVERLPQELRPEENTNGAAVRAIGEFCRGVLSAVHSVVPCVKFQSACFERYGWRGVQALESLIAEAKQMKLEVILDAKRGDIGISADHYAHAAFAGEAPADWITINSYLGADGVEPFVHRGRGAFALVRTSNPGGDAVQAQALAGGGTVAEAVASMIASLGKGHVGDRGFSSLGAVVGATKAGELAALRELMPQQLLLVPGYGAQGGSAESVRPCFVHGRGAIITASRSVIYAFDPADLHWRKSIAKAAGDFALEIASAVNG